MSPRASNVAQQGWCHVVFWDAALEPRGGRDDCGFEPELAAVLSRPIEYEAARAVVFARNTRACLRPRKDDRYMACRPFRTAQIQ